MEQRWMDSRIFLRELNRRVNAQRIPFKGTLHLTHRCNLRCTHCYITTPGQDCIEELGTGEMIRILGEMVDAQCLLLLLSGGEPLLRKDFATIYAEARWKGLLVTVFTNGTLISDEIIALFQKLPPVCVEISFYGASPAVHEQVTGVAGSLEATLDGVKRLVGAGIRVRLKTMLMKSNRKELPAMEALAQALGVDFKMDPVLFPRLNGDRAPMDQQVPPREAVESEFASEKRRESWRKYAEILKESHPTQCRYECGTGLNSFHIDADGMMYPCMMVRHIGFDLKTGNFMEGWSKLAAVREEEPDSSRNCSQCDVRGTCSYCPGCFALEREGRKEYSNYVCAVARERRSALEKIDQVAGVK